MGAIVFTGVRDVTGACLTAVTKAAVALPRVKVIASNDIPETLP
jgi:hypothetical protein